MYFLVMVLAVTTCGLASSASAQQSDPGRFIDARYDVTVLLAKTLWDHAELGYLEEKSSALLQSALSEEGFSVKASVAGITHLRLNRCG